MIMRRRLEIIVPIVLLSILVQVMAPIGAFRAIASAASDPLHMAAICSGTASPTDDGLAAPGKSQHENCCAFCAAGSGGSVVLASPPPVFVSLQRQYQLVSWLQAADPIPALRVGSNAQARAPPAIS
jgi:hypothetical protein